MNGRGAGGRERSIAIWRTYKYPLLSPGLMNLGAKTKFFRCMDFPPPWLLPDNKCTLLIVCWFRDDTDLPVRSTLHEDAAGLKLFLDLLNGHETQNPESEAELRLFFIYCWLLFSEFLELIDYRLILFLIILINLIWFDHIDC